MALAELALLVHSAQKLKSYPCCFSKLYLVYFSAAVHSCQDNSYSIKSEKGGKMRQKAAFASCRRIACPRYGLPCLAQPYVRLPEQPLDSARSCRPADHQALPRLSGAIDPSAPGCRPVWGRSIPPGQHCHKGTPADPIEVAAVAADQPQRLRRPGDDLIPRPVAPDLVDLLHSPQLGQHQTSYRSFPLQSTSKGRPVSRTGEPVRRRCCAAGADGGASPQYRHAQSANNCPPSPCSAHAVPSVLCFLLYYSFVSSLRQLNI